MLLITKIRCWSPHTCLIPASLILYSNMVKKKTNEELMNVKNSLMANIYIVGRYPEMKASLDEENNELNARLIVLEADE